MGCFYLRVLSPYKRTVQAVFGLILVVYVIIFIVFMVLKPTIASYIAVVVFGIFNNVVICVLPLRWIRGEFEFTWKLARLIGSILVAGLVYAYASKWKNIC